MKRTIYTCDICEEEVSEGDLREGIEFDGETKDVCDGCFDNAGECYFCGHLQTIFYTCDTSTCEATVCEECVGCEFQCVKCYGRICLDCVFTTIGKANWKIDSICKQCVPKSHKEEIDQYVDYCVNDSVKSDVIVIERVM